MFNENSNIVKSYVLLIASGEKTINDVPDFQNLKAVVADELAKS